VLAAGAYAFLRRGGAGIGAPVETEEHVLELIHTRVGEQQCRVFMRHQRAGSYDGVAFGGKVIKEFLTDFTAFHVFTNG
jgi:hypothetical protein